MRPCHLERSNINCRACYSTLKCRPLHTNYDSIVTSTSYMPNIPSGNIPHYRHNGILLLYYCIVVHSGFLASSSIPLNSIIFTFFKIAQAPGYAVNDVTGRHCKTFFQAYRSCFRDYDRYFPSLTLRNSMVIRRLSTSGETAICTAADRR